MSENHNSEQVMEGSGDSGPATEALDSEHNHVMVPEESNGYTPETEVAVERGDSNDFIEPVNQESVSSPMNRAEHDFGEAGKEDMFVDCPDELSTTNADNREAVVAVGTEESSEEMNGVHESGVQEMENGTQVGYVVDGELEHLREKLDKMLHERERIAREYESEREAFAEEVAGLHHQLKALTNKQLLLPGMENHLVGDNPLLKMVNDCSEFVKAASEERLQTEATVRDLHALLFSKDQEIEYLNARVTEYGTISVTARDELLELKRKEEDLFEKVRRLEDENGKLVAQLDKNKVVVESVNEELAKTKMELEQEKFRCANTKEKLSMAVTKGKALVQQRDSLKQSLAEKTSELEKCLTELQEKSSSLVAAELSKGELVRSENLVSSLQESLLQRNSILDKLEEILSQAAEPEEIQSLDIIERFRWLVDEKKSLKDVSMEFQIVKDAFSFTDLPETISSSDWEARGSYLRESFYRAKDEINTLRDEIVKTRENAHSEIDRLSASLLAALQEKDYLQTEVADLMCKYEGIDEKVSLEKNRISASLSEALEEKEFLRMELANLMSRYEEIVEKEHQVSLDKDWIVKMLLEFSGSEMENEEGMYQSDNSAIIHKCFEKIKEQSSVALDSSHVNTELFQRVQSILYVRDQELMLCEKLLEEDMVVRLEVNKLSNEIKLLSEELVALKEEKGSLHKDIERSEEKSALLRERLSMAVKKGKGLVQDRENMKNLLDEKDLEIRKLKLELQQQESAVADCRDQINRFTSDVECIPKLEADLVAMKDQRDQLEQFLLESNKLLQRVVECIDGIVLPNESVFEGPVEKVIWLAGYINECLDAKTHADQEVSKAKEDAHTLASKLEEAKATVKSLEDALSIAENNVSRLSEEKREMEVGRTNVEQELQKAMEEAFSQTSKFAEASATMKSLEEALSLAENNISVLFKEKEEAQVSRAAAEMELDKEKEEVAIQATKLTEAYKTIKALEHSLSQVESNVVLLTEQNNDVQMGRTSFENEVKKLQEEVGSLANKLADAYASIKSQEDELLRAENDISVLQGEKKNAEEEVLLLNSKLSATLEELAGTSGSLETRSVELAGHFNDLQVIMKDETLSSKVKECFEKKFESLKTMDLMINNIRDRFVSMDLEDMQSHQLMEDNSRFTKPFSDSIDSIAGVEIDYSWASADSDNISSHFRNAVEGFQWRNKILADKFEGFSSVVDEFVASLLRKLQAAENGVVVLFEHIESLRQKTKDLEMYKQEQATSISILENDVSTLLSVCTTVARELQFEVKNNLLDLSHVPELEKFNHGLSLEMIGSEGVATVEHLERLDGSKYVEAAEKLLLAARKVQAFIKQFESTSNMAASTIEELQTKLKESRKGFEKAIEERDLNQNRVAELETDVDVLQNSCSELRLNLEDYQTKEEKIKEREAEVSSLYNSILIKEQEAEDSPLSASQVKILFDKIRDIEIPIAVSEVGDLDPHNSADIKKLFHIIDSVTELQQEVKFLSHDRTKLHSNLTTQVLEIEHLKGEVEKHIRDGQDLEKTNNELSELIFGLEKIIGMFKVSDLGEQKYPGAKGLLSLLEKQVVAMLLESENSKSKAQELATELLASQNVVEELSIKVKLLEDSVQGSNAEPDIVQERSIFEAPPLPTGSEISEIEDSGPIGQNTVSPVPLAAQVRTLRKGSTDQLAINIGGESERLINNDGADEDKGHVFKSLNTSGLIPKQGKLVADRVDGIWVSGGRVLMSQPRARLGLMAYSLLLHIWLLGTVL
ncbi:myosin heavy chain, non-muscle [Carya illinoinensis]|uniref:Uncharacterized protein n=1 Tax=Carya illinoinensis TaxID=32201 RepID=A0A8T1QK19_CARIL|nr:myosin heavy chain, non-muscle [Carya illinoinensis]KAG6654866.1 hypothetical protein CIPAW_05G175500 [Carya illinoinensis]